MTDTINYTMLGERDFSIPGEPVNSRGETLAEYIDNVRAVYTTLKGDLLYHLAGKRKARHVAVMRMHDKRVASISGKLATIRRIAAFYGVVLR